MLAEWITQRLAVDTGFSPNEPNIAFAAQVAAAMYLGAAGASALMTAFPQVLGAPRLLSAVLCALSLIGAAVWIVVFDRAPMWLLYGGMVFGTLIISVGVAAAQSSGHGVALYVWGVIYAFVFFPRRLVAVGYLAAVCIGYAVILAIAEPGAWLGPWLLGASTLATIGLVVAALRARLEGELRCSEARARTDVLTRLPNRRALMEDLPAAIASGRPHRLMLCDLNGFKAYNDTWGHQEGDRLLARLGARVLATVDGRGSAYRLGGDEFCLLWPLDAGVAVRDVEHALSDHATRISITTAHGDVELPIEAADADTALRIADARMYACKAVQRDSGAAA